MKERLRNNFFVTTIITLTILLGCSEKRKTESLQTDSLDIYYCPMDTEVVQKGPGICPICKMDLEKKEAHKAISDKKNSSLQNPITIPVNAAVFSKVKSVKPIERSLPVQIKANGYISYDARRFYTISAKYEGRIENLYVKYVFQPVKKGQALFDIYSHDLRSAQHNYLLILKNDAGSEDLLNAAREKLLLLGMTEDQIKHLETSEHLKHTTTNYSPYSGYIVDQFPDEKSTVQKSSSDNTSKKEGMASMNQVETENSKNILIREGSFVRKGQEVLKIVNTDVVWAILEVYSEDIAPIKLNLPINIKVENTDLILPGKINFIEPNYNNGSQTLKIRVYLNNNNHELRIGNLISANIDVGEKKALWIPKTAIIDLGNKKVVFVKNKEVFVSKQIETGTVSSENIEVIQGLTIDDEIANNAQFLIDSESFVKIKK